MTITSRIARGLSAAVVIAVCAASQANAAGTAKPVDPKKHSPESIECSKQADAKGLHGKEREKFRSTCKSELKHTNAAAGTAQPAVKAPAAKTK